MRKIGGSVFCAYLLLLAFSIPAGAWFEKPPLPPQTVNHVSSNKSSYIEIGHRSGTPVRLSPAQSGQISGIRRASLSSPLPDLTTVNYTEMPGSIISGDYVFKSGQTYFVRGPVTMTGRVTIQGGAVIKYDDLSTGANLTLRDVVFATSSVDWAVFTSKNDDTIGATIRGSTGTPDFPAYANALTLNGGTARFMQVRYADRAIVYDGSGGNLSVRDAEFYGVGTPLAVSASTSAVAIDLANILTAFSHKGPVFDDRSQYAVTVTAHNMSFFLITGAAFNARLTATGSSFLVADSLFDYVLGSSVFSGTPPVENHNAFYRSRVGSGANDLALQSDPMLADWFLDQTSPLIDGGSRPATVAGLYSYTTNRNLTIEGTTTVDIGYHLPLTARGFSILATDGVRLKEKATIVSGDVGVNNVTTARCDDGRPCRGSGETERDEDAWALRVGERAVTPGGYALFADSVRIDKRAMIGGNVYSNILTNKGTIGGVASTPLPLPLFDVLPVFKSASFGASAANVRVEKKKTRILPPGDYGDVVVENKASLVFQGGVYNIRSLRAKNEASLTFRGLTELRIQEDFKADNKATVGPEQGANLSASDIMFYVAGEQSQTRGDDDAAVSIGENSTAVGHFYAPYGTIKLKEKADFYGILLGKQVTVDENATVTLDARISQETVSTPEILPHGGFFWDSAQVELFTITSGASIYYTLDGSTPTRSSTLYTGPFVLSATTIATLNTIAVRDGWRDSAAASAGFTVKPRPTTDPVTMNPAPGTYRQSVIVSLASATSGASIYYTLDGSTPTRNSTLYSAPIILTSNTVVTAFAAYPEYRDSVVSTASYTIQTIPIMQTGAPDLAQAAPSLKTTLVADMSSGTSFLYSGPNAVQTGVQPGTIETKRAAVLRGQVITRAGDPLPGATISILGHPEFGSTVSRANGLYDMAVNGGSTLVVTYAIPGYIAAQRQVNVPWQDFALVDDVALVPLDANVTAVDLSTATTVQVAQGSPVTDQSGTRQATLMFAPGTTAQMLMPDGTTQPLANLAVRATEFTAGSNGPVAMPAPLPPSSAYTYAVELSVDAAIAAGATTVNFSKPVPIYVENFLNFPVGEPVPNGYFDPKRGVWVPDQSGRIIKILGVTNGLADVDVTGSGTPATATALTALGMDDGERARLATQYSSGQSLWRVPVTHFSAYDFNWGWAGVSGGAIPPMNPPAIPLIPPSNCTICRGSSIQVEGRIMGESVPVAGTPFTIHYNSDRVPGNKNAYKLKIPLIGADVRPAIAQIELAVEIAGRRFVKTFDAPITPNLSHDFEWDRLDAYGREAPGIKQARVTIRYIYTINYRSTTTFGAPGSGPAIGEVRRPFPVAQEYIASIGAVDARPLGLGGWTLNANHIYDPLGRTLHLGDGSRRSPQDMNNVVLTQWGLWGRDFSPKGMVSDDKGNIYFTAAENIYKSTPEGVNTLVGGSGGSGGYASGFRGDGGPVSGARFNSPGKIAMDRMGNLFVVDNANYRIRKIDTNGIISTVAGNGVRGYGGDGGPATQASFGGVNSIGVDLEGNIYIADRESARLRKVDINGIITTIAGTGTYQQPFNGDGIPATQAILHDIQGVAVDSRGNVYVFNRGYFNWSTYTYSPRIHKITPDGIITTIAGNGTENVTDGVPATQSGLNPNIPYNITNATGLIVDKDGSIYISDLNKIRRIGTDGIITTVAGTGVGGYNGDNIPGRSANMSISDITMDPAGNIFLGDETRLRKISLPLPGFSRNNNLIPSEDGTELYVFDYNGRHLQTKNTATNATIYDFAYDTSGRLVSVTDGNGNITTIRRDTSGNVTGVVSPDSQVTALTLNTGGYLASAANANGETTAFAYTADGLLAARTDARGNTTTFVFDANGLLTKDTDAAGGSQSLARIDVNDRKYTVTNTSAMNRVSSYSVETLVTGDKTRRAVVDPSGFTTTTLLGVDDSQTVTDPDGTITQTTKTPDPRWGMQAALSSTKITTPAGLVSNFTATRTVSLSDPLNRFSLTSQTDTVNHNGNTFTTVFDVATLKYTTTTAVGRQSLSLIDGQGHLLKRQFGSLEPTFFAYDTRGRMTTITQSSGALARVSSIAYNPRGYVANVTDPLNRVTGFTYDPTGRATQKTLPDGRIVAYAYDANGNVTSIAPPSRPAHLFAYNALDMESGYTPPALTGPVATQYAYNLDKQLTTVTRPDGQVVIFNYDTNTGRLTSITSGQAPSGSGVTLAYQYSATTGKLTSVANGPASTLALTYDGFLPLSSTWTGTVAGGVSRTYDNFLHVASLSVNGGNTVALTYDKDSLVTQAGALMLTRDTSNGLLTGTTLGGVTDTYAYNSFGEVTGYTAKTGALPVYSAQFTRDALGRVTQKTETVGTATAIHGYTYDTAGRLAAVSLGGVPYSSYQYDSNGNRLGKTLLLNTVNGAYDAQDRLTSWNGTTYVYTANGELQGKTGSMGTTTYTYDALGNLTAVTLPNGTAISYVIDGMNRRIGKKVNSVLTKGWLYDGIRPVAELDGTGAVTATFVYASKANAPDYMVKGGNAYRIVTDHLGSPRLVIDSVTGAVMQQVDYDEFGVIANDTNPGFQPFGFAGGLYDTDTKLTRFGARDYDAETGRWTAKDPILFSGGDTNLYGYVLNDPVNLIDPTGNVADTIVDLAFIGYDLYRLAQDNVVGGCDNLAANATALGADVGGALIPGVTGLGLAVRSSGKLEVHHLLPKEFRDTFAKVGLDIEKYTTKLSAGEHRLKPGGIHTGPNNWNKEWRVFLDRFPTASKQQILNKLSNMIKQFGL